MIAWNADQWTAFGQVGSLVVATVAGVLVWLQVRHGRQIREDQTRPYVIVDFEFRDLNIYVVARNIGTSPARDVEVKFTPPLRSAYPDDEGAVAFADGIPMLAPGRSISIGVGVGPHFFHAKDKPPLHYQATIQYKALRGRRPYIDPPLLLDLRPYEHASIERDHLREIAAQLRAIRWLMTDWSSGRRLKVLLTTESEIREQLLGRLERRRATPKAAGSIDRDKVQQKLVSFIRDIRNGLDHKTSRGEIGDNSP